VTLTEPKEKRCKFLREGIEAMALKNVEVVQRSVQLWPDGQGRFDLVTSRGVRKLPVMVALGAPLLKMGGTLVLWAPAAQNDDLEADTETAAHGFGLVPAGVLSRGALCLHTYTKTESPAPAAAVTVQLLQRWDRSFRRQRRKGLSPSECEDRIARLSKMIADLEEARSHAPETQLAQLESDIRRLQARKVVLAEVQKSLVSTRAGTADPGKGESRHEEEPA
jgi:rRNA small subunit methyltransferase G